jgi:hypothetical protein
MLVPAHPAILGQPAAIRQTCHKLPCALGLIPGYLSRHLTVLEEAGLIQVEKGGARPRPASVAGRYRFGHESRWVLPGAATWP